MASDSSGVRHQRVDGEAKGCSPPRKREGSLLHTIRFREQGEDLILFRGVARGASLFKFRS